MDLTVQGLVTDRGEFQRWRPGIEKKVGEMTEVLASIHTQMDKMV